MGVLARGVKSAFRSGARSVAVVLILAISMGLGLSMLLANQAVKDRLDVVRSEVGTTVMVNPAGARDFQGGGEPLVAKQAQDIRALPNVAVVSEVLNLVAMTEGEEMGKFSIAGGNKVGKTNLEAATEPGTIGARVQSGSVGDVPGNASRPSSNFKLPIRLAGLGGIHDETGQTINVTDGRILSQDDKNHAIVGKRLAEKNELKTGSTFSLYDETFTVVGIFESGTDFGSDALYIPLATAQRLSEAGDEISRIVVKADYIDNLQDVVASIKSKLGEDTVDVTISEENAVTAVEGLRTVERVSLIAFVASLGAAAVIIFLVMLMIVRERRREIGVLKAIGGSNRTIVTQFVAEALTLVLISSTVGFGIAMASGNSIAGALVNSNVNQTTSDSRPQAPRLGSGAIVMRIGGTDEKSAQDYAGDIVVQVSPTALGIGLAAAVVIAFVGSAVPAYAISKIRPAEVLRSE